MENNLVLYLAISASFILTEPFFSYNVTVLELVFVILMLIKATYMYNTRNIVYTV